MRDNLNFASSFHNYLESNSLPSPTDIPEATKYHHFTFGQMSIFFIIGILVIAGIISIILCFRFQKKNARKLQANIQDPFRTKRVSYLQRYDGHPYNHEEIDMNNMNDLDDIEESNIKNRENKITDNINEIDNVIDSTSIDNRRNSDSINLLNSRISRTRLQGSASLPSRSVTAPITHKPIIDSIDDLNNNNNSVDNAELLKTNQP